MSKVFKKHPDWYLDIFGEGDDRENLQNLIDSLNLHKHIFLKGYTKSIRNEISNSDICIVSSRYEGFPMAIVESLALGTPVVSFDCPEGPATLLAGGAGILIPPEDINKLSDGVIQMIESPELRNSCRKKGYDNISDFTPDKVTKKWIDMFHKLLIQ